MILTCKIGEMPNSAWIFASCRRISCVLVLSVCFMDALAPAMQQCKVYLEEGRIRRQSKLDARAEKKQAKDGADGGCNGVEWREGYALSHSQMRISNHKFSACSWPGLDCEGRCRLLDPFFFFFLNAHTPNSLPHTQSNDTQQNVCHFSPSGKIFVSPLTNIVARTETPGPGVSVRHTAAQNTVATYICRHL